MEISNGPFFAVSAKELASGERLSLASLSAKTEKHLHLPILKKEYGMVLTVGMHIFLMMDM